MHGWRWSIVRVGSHPPASRLQRMLFLCIIDPQAASSSNQVCPYQNNFTRVARVVPPINKRCFWNDHSIIEIQHKKYNTGKNISVIYFLSIIWPSSYPYPSIAIALPLPWQKSLLTAFYYCFTHRLTIVLLIAWIKLKVHSLMSSLKTYHLTLPSGQSTCSFVCHFNSTKSIQSCSHFGALNLSYTLQSLSYQVLIFTWVKWSVWGCSALPKDTASKQCP